VKIGGLGKAGEGGVHVRQRAALLAAHRSASGGAKPGRKRQRNESEAAPDGGGKWGDVRVEGTGQGRLYQLGGRSTRGRTQGVRCHVGIQSEVDRGQEEEDNGEGPC
jgi:hypothetical protein